jgi:hypothetical protein
LKRESAKQGFNPVDDQVLIYVLHPSSPAVLTDRLTSPAAHIGSDKRRATGTEGIPMLRLVLRAGRLGRGLRPKSTARAAGMLFVREGAGYEQHSHKYTNATGEHITVRVRVRGNDQVKSSELLRHSFLLYRTRGPFLLKNNSCIASHQK